MKNAFYMKKAFMPSADLVRRLFTRIEAGHDYYKAVDDEVISDIDHPACRIRSGHAYIGSNYVYYNGEMPSRIAENYQRQSDPFDKDYLLETFTIDLNESQDLFDGLNDYALDLADIFSHDDAPGDHGFETLFATNCRTMTNTMDGEDVLLGIYGVLKDTRNGMLIGVSHRANVDMTKMVKENEPTFIKSLRFHKLNMPEADAVKLFAGHALKCPGAKFTEILGSINKGGIVSPAEIIIDSIALDNKGMHVNSGSYAAFMAGIMFSGQDVKPNFRLDNISNVQIDSVINPGDALPVTHKISFDASGQGDQAPYNVCFVADVRCTPFMHKDIKSKDIVINIERASGNKGDQVNFEAARTARDAVFTIVNKANLFLMQRHHSTGEVRFTYQSPEIAPIRQHTP